MQDIGTICYTPSIGELICRRSVGEEVTFALKVAVEFKILYLIALFSRGEFICLKSNYKRGVSRGKYSEVLLKLFKSQLFSLRPVNFETLFK